jgi:ribosomal protein S12 methylthiotransferase
MRVRKPVRPQVFIHTLGCPKNEADSRSLVRTMAAAGIPVTEDPRAASHIVVNTCGFIQEAKEESIAAILETCAAYPDTPVLVVGCLVERYRRELAAGIPEVSGWFGLLTRPEREALVRSLLGGEPSPARDSLGYLASGTTLPARTAFAYLKISDGCDGPCTFCAIPGIKGPYRPLSVQEIWAEAQACLAEGARELVLVGQNTACWANDGLDLAGLVDLLAADDRVAWIRVMYLQPEDVTTQFLEYMARQPKLCPYLDLPFQHSHPEILRRMGRAGEGAVYLRLLSEARRLVPGVAVRSAFIVGFPGETEEQFEHLLAFVREAEFDYGGGFIYSPEEGTLAAGFKPRVRRAEARLRLNRLQDELLASSEAARRRLLGRKVEVMIDGLGPEDRGDDFAAVGRTRGQAPEVDGVTYIEGDLPPGVGVGDVVEATIEAVVGYDLVGSIDLP